MVRFFVPLFLFLFLRFSMRKMFVLNNFFLSLFLSFVWLWRKTSKDSFHNGRAPTRTTDSQIPQLLHLFPSFPFSPSQRSPPPRSHSTRSRSLQTRAHRTIRVRSRSQSKRELASESFFPTQAHFAFFSECCVFNIVGKGGGE